MSQVNIISSFLRNTLGETEVPISRKLVATSEAVYCDGHQLAVFSDDALKLHNLNPAWGGPSVSRSVSYALNQLKEQAEKLSLRTHVVPTEEWEWAVGSARVVGTFAFYATEPEKRPHLPLTDSGLPEPLLAFETYTDNRHFCDTTLRMAGYDVPEDIKERHIVFKEHYLLVDAGARSVSVITRAEAEARKIPAIGLPQHFSIWVLESPKDDEPGRLMSAAFALLAPNNADPSPGAGRRSAEEASSEPTEEQVPPEKALSGGALLAGASPVSVEEVKQLAVEAVRGFTEEEITAALRPVLLRLGLVEGLLARALGTEPKRLREALDATLINLESALAESSTLTPPRAKLRPPASLYQADETLGF